MDEHPVRALISTFALGALSEAEENIVRAHILQCEECMAEADAYLRVSNALALSVPMTPAPAGLIERVVSRIHEDRSPSRLAPPRRSRRLISVFVVGAVLAATIASGLFVFDLRNQVDQTQRALAALLSGEAIELSGGDAVARLAPTEKGSVLVVAGLPAAPQDRTYQLWLLGEEVPVSAGTFDVTQDLSLIETRRSLEDFTGAAVTIEPRGGSRQPTTQPILTSG